MTIATRLSWFFLLALALVLGGFSSSLYLLARYALYRQLDDRLEGALATLEAAAEIDRNGMEWESSERLRSFGKDESNRIHWTVRDGQGKFVDGRGFTDFKDQEEWGTAFAALATDRTARQEVYWRGEPWRASLFRLDAPNALETSRQSQPDKPQEMSRRYPSLVITAAVPLAPVQATLQRVLLALALISGGLWVMALFVGRWLCRRALGPLTRMATSARAMKGADLDERLPHVHTKDEMESLGRAINGLLDRLHESFERQRQFTGDASHQLRTPLTAMLGQIDVALRRDRPLEEYQRVLSSVRGQAIQLREIVEMLLFLARADAEARLPHLQSIALAEWLHEHLEQRSGTARAADLKNETQSAGPLFVRGQAPLLAQLVDNLLDNACKYSQPGTPVKLRIRRAQDFICLDVEDQGCGIDAEDLPHVFEPFYRSQNARQLGHNGIGLGLSVAQRIACAFGGKITVTSQQGRGSCFTVWLLPGEPGFSQDETDATTSPSAVTTGA